jgi:hypothetical protein
MDTPNVTMDTSDVRKDVPDGPSDTSNVRKDVSDESKGRFIVK